METWKLICCALAVPIVIGFLPALPLFIPVIIPVVIIGIILYYVRPDVLFMLFSEVMMWWHGCKQRFRNVNGYTFSYAERGRLNQNKPTMLYLHGFSAAKYMFLPCMPKIPKEWHVILLDLPGHGKTTMQMTDDFTLEAQAERVHQFVLALQLNKHPLHLIGTSMGGGIAGLYAAKYPKDLIKLTVICPAGIKSETLSDYQVAMKDHKISGEFPQDAAEYAKALPYLTYTVPKLSKQYLKGIELSRKKSNIFYKKVVSDLMSNESIDSLRENMGDITVPTQVIWGRNDGLLHPSGAEVLREGIPNIEIHMLERCGHLVILERPYKTTKLILAFSESC